MNILRPTLLFAAGLEIVTGIVLLAVPRFALAALVGESEPILAARLMQFLGIALLALGIGAWPRAAEGPKFPCGMLCYNVLATGFLAFQGVTGHFHGWLIGPGVVLHAGLTMLLVWGWRAATK